jgi:hypothetical protein
MTPALNKHGVKGKSGDSPLTSNTAAHALARLKRDAPDLAEKVIHGDVSANARAMDAYVKRMERSKDAKREAHNNISEAILRQERRIGELLSEMQAAGELASRGGQAGNSNASKNEGDGASPSFPTYNEVGSAKHRSPSEVERAPRPDTRRARLA